MKKTKIYFNFARKQCRSRLHHNLLDEKHKLFQLDHLSTDFLDISSINKVKM